MTAAELRSVCLRPVLVAILFVGEAGPGSCVQPLLELDQRQCAEQRYGAEQGCPNLEEPFSRQLVRLLHDGNPVPSCVVVLRLISNIGWTTRVAEQQHGAVRCVPEVAPNYGANMRAATTLILDVSNRLQSRRGTGQSLARLNRQLDKLLSMNPDNASGRHILVKDLFAQLRRQGGPTAFTTHLRMWLSWVASDMQFSVSGLARRRHLAVNSQLAPPQGIRAWN